MKKIFLFVLASVFTLTVEAQDLVVLHLNDTHSHIDPERAGKHEGLGGVIEQAAYVDQVREEMGRRNVILLHAGDFSQGSSYFTELNGDVEIDVLNAMDFDVVAIGNHEFDNGVAQLARRLSDLKMDVVCANYDFSGSPLAQYIKPYSIIRKAGLKIGVIGLLADLSDIVDARIAADFVYQDPIETAQRYATYLKEDKGCDLVICLTHIGFDGEDSDCELAVSTKDIDIIVGGHSHTHLDDCVRMKNLEGDEVIILSDWKWGLNVGRLNIDL